jgi:V/A-type H+-transporting ATPase subunit D
MTTPRGLDLLDRKLRLLREEQTRLEQLAGQTARDWVGAVADTSTWTTRAAALGGDRPWTRLPA